MKTAKRIFFILTVVCGALAVVFDIVAVCMQVQVSGEKLLTMDSHWGYILAVNYRWVTLAAVILTVSALAMLTAYILYRRKRKKTHKCRKADFPLKHPAARGVFLRES